MTTRKTLNAVNAAAVNTAIKRSEEVYFGELLSDIGTKAELLDAFTQARLLVDLARSIISSLGWNRAFLEQIFYTTAERALGLQGCPRDEAGFFISEEPSERGTNVNGHEIHSLYDRLSPKQLDLVDDLEMKETNLWDVFDEIKDAWQTLTGEYGSPVKPSAAQKAKGLTSLDDLVEDAKRNALEYKVNGNVMEQARHSKEQAQIVSFKAAQRAAERAKRSEKIR